MAADKLLTRDNMKSAIRSPNLKIWPLVRFWLIKRPLRPLAFQDPSAFIARKLVSGSPSGHPPAPKRRKRARGRLSQQLWPSPGKLFREARRASPQRQNNGARASDGAGLPWLSRKLQPSPGKLFREATGQLPAPKLRKRARATRPSQAVASPRKFSREARRARPQRQNDGNELSGSPTGQTQAQTFDDSSRREKWHATRPGRSNPKP